MLKCKLEKSSTSCNIDDNKYQLITNDRTSTITLTNKNDADNCTTAASSTSLLAQRTHSQELQRFVVIPKPRVLNICALNPNRKEFEVPTGSLYTPQATELSIQAARVDFNKSKHERPQFLYEQYPLKPALLYDSPLSFVRDPLSRLDQIAYLPQSSLHSITSVLPTCQCALELTPYNLPEYPSNAQNSRLISGEEECRYNEIAKAAWKTREAFASTEDTSTESVCSTCHRKGFLVPHSSQYYTDPNNELVVEPSTMRETDDAATLSEVYKTARQSIADNENHLERKESCLFHNPCYRYETKNIVEPPLEPVISSDNSRLAMSLDSYELDYYKSVPVFEVLPTNNFEDYSHQPALRHIDSLLLYARFKQKRRKARDTFELGEGKPLRFIAFFDDAQLVKKSSDEDIIFGGAHGLNYKLQCWEESRIAWLSELERRHEVYRRRQKRAELRKLKQQSAQSCSGQCSLWCQRLRSWLAKWRG
ncbi:uncharacterized protein LOC105230477 [Bactrocera dorsalis]|uniref:Uncharacterized protein LOC105230477 n=1 Tax=Bactrocera dorsalis TaxID=27457 RepID=A0A6I9VAM1_BACDO|nr:uncharacterized protein LOC105230477 [Bactrocera dorsalis]